VTVRIKQLGAEVPGQVIKKYDGTTTTLILDETQARTLHADLGNVVKFFDSQNATGAVAKSA
jgi:N-acetylglucosamine kinase-like BadF-type ATPase